MLSRLRLRHFRNYQSLDIDFDDPVTLLTGANGQGKTNILEAVHYLSVLRSFRTRKTSDLKQWNSRFFFVEGVMRETTDYIGPHKISISYADERRLRIDGSIVTRAVDFIGRFRSVVCAPEDIQIIKGSPVNRRRFIDMLLCQSSGAYLSDLIKYQAALKNRNRMLKDCASFDRRSLAAYDKVAVNYGVAVINARREFSRLFDERLSAEGQRLFGDSADISFSYNSDMETVAEETDAGSQVEEYKRLLFEGIEKDNAQKRTCIGPHLDDYSMTLNGIEVREFGSEGQCRTMSLALKMAAVDCLKDKPGTPLILLVDDVLGELDERRRELFFANFRKATQVIVACTEALPELKQQAGLVYEVKNGKTAVGGFNS